MKCQFKLKHLILAALVIKAVLYGGAKNTNLVTQVAAPQSASCNVLLRGEQTATDSSCGVARAASVVATPNRSQFAFGGADCVQNWTARGAYCDWERIEFRNGFAFPIGTNFIEAVMLMSYGEIRANIHCTTTPPDYDYYSLPARVSLEPNASSLTHGLTPSNSYLFAWHNCWLFGEMWHGLWRHEVRAASQGGMTSILFRSAA